VGGCRGGGGWWLLRGGVSGGGGGGGANALRYTLTVAKCTAPAIIGSYDTHRNKWIAVLTHKAQGVLCILNPSITL